MNYVIAAYAFTIALIGGYALSIVLRRRAVERELAAGLPGVEPEGVDPRGATALAGTADAVDAADAAGASDRPARDQGRGEPP